MLVQRREFTPNGPAGSRDRFALKPIRLSLLASLGAICLLSTVLAQDMPDYQDDRSTPRSVVESLYNAIARHEYLRAWSYFRDEPGRPSLENFAKGYEDTSSVRVRIGDGEAEGAAGSTYTSLPVVIEATGRSGDTSVYAGCYLLRFVVPGIQATPPFEPLGIVKGRLQPAQQSFDDARGSCDNITQPSGAAQ